MKLDTLTVKLIEHGLNEDLANDLVLAHNRYIRSIVDNNPSIKAINNFMEDYRDEFGHESADLAIANGAIMYFSKVKKDVNEKFIERMVKDKEIMNVIADFQKSEFKPDYDELSVPEEMFDL